MLRLIQFFNSGAYYECLDQSTEDRFCPGSIPPLSEFQIFVDETIEPKNDGFPDLLTGALTRPVAAMMDERGKQVDFVANELLIVTDDVDALNAFLARWDGEILQTIDPAEGDLDLPLMYHVRIDTSLADTSQLREELLALEPDARGITAVSSEQGLELLAAAAQEAMGGLSIGVNWIGEGDSLGGRFTQESASGPDGFSPDFYSSNAFNWNYLNLASPQRIGVTEAWYMLDRAGKLSNKVKVAILDMGFDVTGNQDMPAGWVAGSNVPFQGATDTANLLGCSGGSSCPWHGTNVASAAFGVVDNRYGGAGPGGPVAAPVLIYTLYDFITSIGAVVQALARGARVINMSYGARVPAVVSWTVLPFDATTAAASLRAVIFASAGNDGANVDAEDCFIVCWEEAWHTPCENAGVTCVGGLARSSTSRDPGSNRGSEDVDIFAPYTVIVGPDQGRDETRSINGTSFSSPFAAGVAALVWAANPSLSAGQVRDILRDNARTSSDPTVGRYINA
ncbi:MAG: S8/S53 family peptidase, partial [Candidatus Hydrogenedentes bacterium]|nr:S8/S53 family peptidase [Candidatus Hydrogenedentota bacterium]